MKALSVRQPWAWAILHAGKFVENRTWATAYRGPLLLHASNRYDMDGKHWIRNIIGIHVPPNLQCGGIVGRVHLAGCYDHEHLVRLRASAGHHDQPLADRILRSAWYGRGVAWVFTNPQPLPFVPCRGKLGLFEAPEQGVLELGS
jgi:hypothetical protein